MNIIGYIIGGIGSLILLFAWFRNEEVVTTGTDEEYKRHRMIMIIGALLAFIGTSLQVHLA